MPIVLYQPCRWC